MNRPNFITMSTLALTVIAYIALTQTAQPDDVFALDLRGSPPEAVGTGFQALPLSWANNGAPTRR